MRQPRIKRESDPPQETSESDLGLQPSSSHYLTVPPVRIERQCSDPLPASVSPSSENLLSVSEHILMKQHSHPLLPTKPIEVSLKISSTIFNEKYVNKISVLFNFNQLIWKKHLVKLRGLN